MSSARDTHRQSGLCATCLHARTVKSSKGSQFVLCGRAELDSAYDKYPRLPVVSCAGHEAREKLTGDSGSAPR